MLLVKHKILSILFILLIAPKYPAMRILYFFIIAVCCAFWCQAQNAFPRIEPKLVVHTSSDITDIANAGDDRLFLVEQDGIIRIIDTAGNFRYNALLNIKSAVNIGPNEFGLLGLVFHPQFPDSNYFYINYVDLQENSVIARYEVSANPDSANPSSAKIILTLPQPSKFHNGGDLNFGPDGMLYIGFGDGGQNQSSSQDSSTFLGKMLRIDVDNGDPYAIPPDNPYVGDTNALDEIWAFGLRNPWRYSFDRLTGDMWIGDVGDLAIEEINFQPSNSIGGENYGWDCYEGTSPKSVGAPHCQPVTQSVFPVFEYPHVNGGECSVTGGYVYRGSWYPDMNGWYITADFCTGQFWVITSDGQGGWLNYEASNTLFRNVSTFGEDKDGELFLAERNNNNIWRVTNACEGRKVDANITASHCLADTGGIINLTPVNLTLPISYAWSNNDTTQSIYQLSAGDYTVTVVDSINCRVEYTITVQQEQFEVNTSPDTSICERENVQLVASAGASWVWQPDSSLNNNTVQQPIANPQQTTTYVVTATDTQGCTDTDTVTVEVYQTIKPTITQSGDTLFSSPAVSYQWFVDGIELPGETDNFYVSIFSDAYTVVATDSNGCETTSNPYNFTVGILETLQQNIHLYPNPATSTLHIELPSNTTVQLEVIDLTGKVLDIKTTTGTTALDISYHPTGIYLLKLTADDEVIYRKWVKGE